MRTVLLAAGLAGAAALAGVALAQEQAPPSATTLPAAAGSPIPSDAVPPEEAAPEAVPKVIRVTPSEPEENEAAPAAPEKPPEPLKRPRLGAAVLQALDKTTAETLRFEARINAPVRYKGVVINVRACETTAGDEPNADSMAHLDVTSQPQAAPGRPAPAARNVYRGWMFANSPALHPFEHPSYDLWLIACKAASPVVSAGRA